MYCAVFDVFPLPFFLLSPSSALTPRVLDLLNGTISGLNSLYDAPPAEHVTNHPPDATLSLVQRRIVDSLLVKIKRFDLQSKTPLPLTSSDLNPKAPTSSYNMTPLELVLNHGFLESQGLNQAVEGVTKGSYKLADCDRLSLPNVGATVPILDFLPPEIAETYATASSILRNPTPSSEELQKIPVLMGVKKGHYPRIINKLLEAGCVSLVDKKPACTNGLFAVTKDSDSDRLIFDGRRANMFFFRPPSPDLVSPSDLADLYLAPGTRLFVAKSDITSMYHLLRVPQWMSTYLALPPLRSSVLGLKGRALVWPVFLSLPMGFSHSVYVAHSLHQHIVRSTLSPHCSQLTSSNFWLQRSASLFFSYIDDHGIFSPSAEEARSFLELSVAALDAVGLQHHPKKCVLPSSDFRGTEVLGLSVAVEGTVSPDRVRLDMLIRWTTTIIDSGSTSLSTLQRLTGSWIWFLLVMRSLLSALESVFEFTSFLTSKDFQGNQLFTLPVSVMEEFRRLVNLSPILVVDLTLNCSSYAVATDASLTGGAVTTAPLSVDHFKSLTPFAHRRGWYSFLRPGSGSPAT